MGSVDKLREPEGERKPFSIITASRLANEKHVDWLVKAVVKAKESLPQVNFDIFGTGAEESKLKAIIEENQAQDYIHLKGHQDLIEVYKDYELYLSGSKSEGFGIDTSRSCWFGPWYDWFWCPLWKPNFYQG